MKRVVVTGLGIVSPLGNNLEQNWEAVKSGKSGVTHVESQPIEGLVRIAGVVKGFDPTLHMSEKEAKRTERFIQFAVAATKMALKDADLHDLPESVRNEIGTSIGVGVGGLGFLEEQILTLHNRGYNRVSPFTIPVFIPNMATGIVSIETGLRGPNICTTTACSSGSHGIGEALMLIQTGRAKAMVAGGAEAALSPLAFAGFGRMKALCSKYQDTPEKASRPFDGARAGFVMGEGAGVLVLEEYEFAKARGARIYCELVGYGMSSDANHMTAPSPGGEGAARCMNQALSTGGLNPSEIDYINAHGTSTEANDMLETAAIKAVFGDHARALNISSTKSMTGHLLGAAGGVEAVFTVLAMHHGVVPPTINQETPDPDCDLNYTPNVSVRREIRAALSNSFGFGGTNACLAFRKM